MIALIDADIVVYQSAANAEKTLDWGEDDDSISIIGSKSETRDGIDHAVDKIKKAVGADRVLMIFSDTEHFRKKVFAPYKGNRKGKRKPVTFAWGKAYTKKRYDSMTREMLEADDCLGIMATGNVAGFTAPRVVCSIDKDMLTFPCMLYNWNHADWGVYEVGKVDADYNFYAQCLTGDATDGYPGVPGIGPVKAAKILKDICILPGAKTGVDPYVDHAMAWELIVGAYGTQNLDENYALSQARCARILRAEDYDFETKTPILWTPTKRTYVPPKGAEK